MNVMLIDINYSFWKYHFDSTNFLDKLADRSNFNRIKYPWDYKSIRWGDLDRVFVKYLTSEYSDIGMLLKETNTFSVKFLEIQLQFKRITSSKETMRRIQAEIDDFVSEKSKNIHTIKIFLLGI